MPTVDSYNAAQAYNRVVQSQTAETGYRDSDFGPEPAIVSPFLETVQGFTQKAIDDNRTAEDLSYGALRGEVEMTELVPALLNAEHKLNTIVAFRDRIVSAYQEIIRMPL
ncbi:MAG: flagellar hook-basal body complex protein FliE [Alphaproteobacteria bacterium]|nr:flagellar hook-basal body complex protein FliE [Alphaproteobacteria bacterium]